MDVSTSTAGSPPSPRTRCPSLQHEEGHGCPGKTVGLLHRGHRPVRELGTGSPGTVQVGVEGLGTVESVVVRQVSSDSTVQYLVGGFSTPTPLLPVRGTGGTDTSTGQSRVRVRGSSSTVTVGPPRREGDVGTS